MKKTILALLTTVALITNSHAIEKTTELIKSSSSKFTAVAVEENQDTIEFFESIPLVEETDYEEGSGNTQFTPIERKNILLNHVDSLTLYK